MSGTDEPGGDDLNGHGSDGDAAQSPLPPPPPSVAGAPGAGPSATGPSATQPLPPPPAGSPASASASASAGAAGGAPGPFTRFLELPPKILFGTVGLAVIVVIGGSCLVFGGTKEVSAREWASGVCETVEEIDEKGEKFTDELDEMYSASVDKDSTEELLNAMVALIGLQQDGLKKIRDFNSGHIVRGDGGDEFREGLDESISEYLDDLDEAKGDLKDLDAGDEEDALIDASEILQDLRLDVDFGSSAGGKVQSALSSRESDCSSNWF